MTRRTDPVPRLYVVTHTESQHHVDRLAGGWYDSHLTERGRHQADAIAERLAAEIDDREVAVFTSDLARAVETAEPIAHRFSTTAHPMPDVREVSQGVADGRPGSWYVEHVVAAPDDDRLDHVSFEGAESTRTAATRVFRAVDQILDDPAPTAVVVTHGHAMTFVVAAWIRLPLDALGHVRFGSSSGGITLLEEDDLVHDRVVRYLDDTSHLR